MIGQRNQGMTLQWNGAKISTKRFPVHIHLPACCIRQLAEIPHLLEPLSPDVKEVAEGGGNALRSLNVDDPAIVVRMKPVEARIVRGNPNIRRNGCFRSIHIHRHMRMDVRAALLSTLTGNAIYRRVRGIGGGLAFRYNDGDKASNSQREQTDDAECRDKLHARSTPPLFFSPKLAPPPSFLPVRFTGGFVTHK